MSTAPKANRKLGGWRLTRKQTREARRELKRTGDLNAIECLLRHSIAYGHDRLTIRRFLLAKKLGMRDLHEYEPFFHDAIKRLDAGRRHAASGEIQADPFQVEAQRTTVTACGNPATNSPEQAAAGGEA